MTGLSEAHAARLIERHLDPALAASLGVVTIDEATIGFQYVVQGQLHNTKLRRGKGNMPWAEKDRPLALWGIDDLAGPIDPTEPLIITEGEFDRIAMRQAGFRRVVSVPNGAPKRGSDGGKRYEYLYTSDKKLHSDIDKFKIVILAVDGDGPGQALRDDLAVRIGDERCWWISWPEGCKDANDVLVASAGNVEPLVQCVSGAKRMWIDFVAKMSDIPDEVEEVGIETGFDSFDAELSAGGIRLPESGFMTVVGPAHSGKSVLVRQLLWQQWQHHGRPFAITALEEKAKPRYLRAFRKLSIGSDPWSHETVGRADIEIEQAATFIQRPPRGMLDLETLLASVEFAVKVYGVQTVCIDPVNEIDHDFGGNKSQTDVIGKMIMSLKELADRYRILVICVSHPPIDVVRRKGIKDLWSLYDAEGSRHWAGKSDVGWAVWRPFHGGPTLLHVSKLKSNEIFGVPNLWLLRHDAEKGTFEPTMSGYESVISQVETEYELRRGGGDRPARANGARPARFSAHSD
jgi:twinkle protein